MDSRLFIDINIDITTFQAIDNSPYERWQHDGDFDENHSHAILQRLVKVGNDGNELVDFDLRVADELDEFSKSWEVETVKNGLYYYQKLILPTQGHASNANEVIWYDAIEDVVFYYDIDADTTDEFEVWDNFDDIYELVRLENPDNCFYFDDYTFTARELTECYMMLQKERIESYLKNNCKDNCKSDINLDMKINLLLGAIMVIDDLIQKGDFYEAQRILDSLDTCGSLCGKYRASLKGCGCGRT